MKNNNKWLNDLPRDPTVEGLAPEVTGRLPFLAEAHTKRTHLVKTIAELLRLLRSNCHGY